MFERLRRRAAKPALEFDSTSVLRLASVSPNLVAIAIDGRLVVAYTAAERVVGESTTGGLVGRALLELVHAEHRERASALLEQGRATGQAEAWTGVRLVTLDSRPIDLDVSFTSVSLRGQRAVIVNGRDDRQARRAQVALIESERRYQSLIAAAPVAIYRLDAEGRCIYLNPRWSELTGIPLEEALGRRWFDFVPDERKAAAREVWSRIANAPGTYSLEQTVHHRDGSRIQIFTRVVSETDADGRVIGWVGTLTDLTDLKETRAALARSEERLRLALQAASMVTWGFDVASGRIEWSENADAVLGVPEGTLPSDIETARRLMPPRDVVFRSGSARDSIALGEPFELEARLLLPGAEPRWILARGQAHRGGSGERRRVVGVVVDFTARRHDADERAQLEQKLVEAQRLESLGLLAGGVAHDFNNLLVGILGNAELALTRLADDAPAKALVAEVRDAGVRAGELARQSLTYSGSEPRSSQPVDLVELARDTLALLRLTLPHGAHLDVATPETPAFVAGDPTQLRQVLMNLVINACEALVAGAGEVQISIAPLAVAAPDEDGAPPAAFIALDVRDTGIGMDAQTRARIFDPFYTTRASGRGLGLAVVHGIVRSHGGAIEVESEPGAGTRMRVLLPALSQHALPAQPAPVRPGAHASAPVGSALVLVVDDERSVREVVRLTLESAGHRVLLAGNAADAHALLAAHGADVGAILLDLSLGPESSERLLAEIRAHSSAVPVLLTSGFPEEEAIGRLARLGVSAFVQKPFSPARLNAAIARVLASESPVKLA